MTESGPASSAPNLLTLPEKNGEGMDDNDLTAEKGLHPAKHLEESESPDLLDRTWAPKKKRESIPRSSPGPAPTNSSSNAGSRKSLPSLSQRNRPQLPKVGEELFGFRLLRELGRGSFARVFLAEQDHLAGRPVVLKVSAITGNEPQMLAQLQHTHIMPIYSLHEDPFLGLRAVCMPYFGGASLSETSKELHTHIPSPTEGEQLLNALRKLENNPDADSDEEPESKTGRPTIANVIPWKGESYVRAVVWMIARLAEGLDHAHKRGVLHRDVKPSNVLVTTEGDPMLLDFNISLPLIDGRLPEGADVSGTVTYMSPEQLKALVTRDPELARQVDQRSDTYSLGMVLYEMLAGAKPFGATASYSAAGTLVESMARERAEVCPSVRTKKPEIPWGLESIVRKALAPDPNERYQEATQLAEDCQRFLDHRPLKHAPELSRVEQVQKWLRRNPRTAYAGTVGLIATMAICLILAGYFAVRNSLTTAEDRLAKVETQKRARQHHLGSNKAIFLLSTFNDLTDHADEGRKVCEHTLQTYKVLSNENWQQSPELQTLPEADRQRIVSDTQELLLLLAFARRQASPKDPATLKNALELLDRADKIQGLPRSRAIQEARATYLAELGLDSEAKRAAKEAQSIPYASARDHYLLAQTYAKAGKYPEAIQALNRALEQKPSHYWSIMQRGICYQEMGQAGLALADFRYCEALLPTHGWASFNCGFVLEQMKHVPQALEAYGRAIKRDPGLLVARWNRGLLHLEHQNHAEALTDLNFVEEHGRDGAVLQFARGAALEGLKRHTEADKTFAQAQKMLKDVSPEMKTKCLLTYAFAIWGRLPQKAKETFDVILSWESHQPQALYGLAMILATEEQAEESIGCLDQAILASPNFVEARRHRAIQLSRLGEIQRASQDINWCLEKEPTGGATLYATACVAARAAENLSDETQRSQVIASALDWLKKAFEQGYGKDRAAQDPDLAILRQHPEFLKLVN